MKRSVDIDLGDLRHDVNDDTLYDSSPIKLENRSTDYLAVYTLQNEIDEQKKE